MCRMASLLGLAPATGYLSVEHFRIVHSSLCSAVEKRKLKMSLSFRFNFGHLTARHVFDVPLLQRRRGTCQIECKLLSTGKQSIKTHHKQLLRFFGAAAASTVTKRTLLANFGIGPLLYYPALTSTPHPLANICMLSMSSH